MNYINEVLRNPIIEAFGWTIVHSIWQIALWAIIAVTVLILTHKRQANIRYFSLIAILFGICTTSVITFKKYSDIRVFEDQQIVRNETPVQAKTIQIPVIPDNGYLNPGSTNVRLKILYWFRNYFEAHLPGIVSLWFLGFIFLFLRYLGSFAWLMRLKGSCTVASDYFQELIYKLCRKLQIKRIVNIGTSIRIDAPVTIGHFKPVILFPARLLTGLTNEQLESILLHELAHIKRNDFLINIIHGFIEVVFFYHPAIWWLSAAIRTEREHACDDLALKGGANAVSLAQTLADLACFVTPNPAFSQAFSGKQHKLKNRIHRLILNEKMKTNLSEKVIVAVVLIISIAALSFGVQKNNTGTNPEQVQITSAQTEPQHIPVQTALNNTDTYTVSTIPPNEMEKQDVKDAGLSNYTVQEDSAKKTEDDDEFESQVLITLMTKGAKEWNKYRKEHQGDNFDEVLKESNLSGFDLSNFNLSYMNLNEAALVNTNFTNANMTGVNIKEADVKGAIFENAVLSNSDMKELTMDGNNLRNAVLSGANLKEITLINCDLSGADLTGCNLKEATIKMCSFKGAFANQATLFPPGFDWAEQGIELK